VIGFKSDRERMGLDSDRMLLLAVVRGIEIIGEAAARMSREAQEAAPEILDGDGLDASSPDPRLLRRGPDIEWQTATEEVPALIP